MSTTAITYAGTTPGADASTYPLFDTTTASPNARGFFALAGIQRVRLELEHTQAGTLNASWSQDGGTTWVVHDSTAVAIPAANQSTGVDYNVGNYRDWKLEWVNGGVAQASWIVALSMSDDQASVI